MKYFQFHIGDWDTSTRYLSPTERGVYIDLLVMYYSTETPVIRPYIERMSRAYTEDEKRALEFVLNQFFTEEEDGFHCKRCDAEIKAWRQKSAKATAAISQRWATASKEKTENEISHSANSDTDVLRSNSECSTDVLRTNNERSTDVVLTNNHKPIYINKEKEDKEKEISGSQAPAQTAPTEATVSKRQPIPYQKIQDLYNEVAGDKLPKAVSLNDKRKSDIAARVRELAKVRPIHSQDDLLRELRAVFTRLVSDPWYCGKNDRGWIASIDYIFSVKGFTKFLERPDDFRTHAPEQPKAPNQISRLPTPREFTAEELMGNITGN